MLDREAFLSAIGKLQALAKELYPGMKKETYHEMAREALEALRGSAELEWEDRDSG